MSLGLTFVLIVTATAADGLLAGASLDQSIKQLPARHKIGSVAYSAYSRASDLGPGILWYGVLGVGPLCSRSPRRSPPSLREYRP